MSEYVVAFDSSGNGTYYAMAICDVSTFKSIMSYLNRITSKYHIAEVRLLRSRLVNVVLDMVEQDLIPVCMYVYLPEIKTFIKNINPRLSKKRIERIAYKAVR